MLHYEQYVTHRMIKQCSSFVLWEGSTSLSNSSPAHRAATGDGASPSTMLPSRTSPLHSNTVGEALVAAALPFVGPAVGPLLPPLPPLPPLPFPTLLRCVTVPLVALITVAVTPFTTCAAVPCAAATDSSAVCAWAVPLLGNSAGPSVPFTSSAVATSSAFAIVQKLGSLQT